MLKKVFIFIPATHIMREFREFFKIYIFNLLSERGWVSISWSKVQFFGKPGSQIPKMN